MLTHTLRLILALAALNGPAALPATEYKVSDFLPLAVGNSWTCNHGVYDSFGRLSDHGPWPAWEDASGVFTLRVERTEEIDGETYYVLSDMPSGGWPPAPPGFIAGKKLRWEGTQLMEHTGTSEQILYDFGGSEGYKIEPTTSYPVPRFSFGFAADDLVEWLEAQDYEDVHSESRIIVFLAKYGVWACYESVALADAGAFRNEIAISEAALIESAEGVASGASGDARVVRTLKYHDARKGEPGTTTPISSSVSPSSWGEVKEWDR